MIVATHGLGMGNCPICETDENVVIADDESMLEAKRRINDERDMDITLTAFKTHMYNHIKWELEV